MVRSIFFLFLVSTGFAQTPAQFAALQAQVASLQSLCAQMIRNEQGLQTQLTALRTSPVQALVPFLTVDPNPKNGVRGPNIVFHDANVHITNGDVRHGDR